MNFRHHWIIETIKPIWIEFEILCKAQKSHRVNVPCAANLLNIWIICIHPDRQFCVRAVCLVETQWPNMQSSTAGAMLCGSGIYFYSLFYPTKKFMRSTIKIDIEINCRRTDCPNAAHQNKIVKNPTKLVQTKPYPSLRCVVAFCAGVYACLAGGDVAAIIHC